MASACPEPKRCSLCGGVDHLFRACPTRKKSFASLFREGHDLQADLESLLTSLPAEMESQEAGPSSADQGARETKGCRGEVPGNSREEVRDEESVRQLVPSQEWSEIDVTEVLSGIFESQRDLTTRPMNLREGQSASVGGENQPQQDDVSSEPMEVAQGQPRRRLTEDTESQERERKCSRVGLLSSSLLQELAPVQDWEKVVQEEEIPGRVEVEVEVERENGCGAKE